ncbi:flavin reductase family protein [Nocardia harenae]|uniref:flavin reductase family protein n=1 Tax=Nocardia harenae TaxID=358707 RepID=UPI00082E03D0|nr:flavin reductase family protein [Nocardia harenae]
MSHTTVKAEDYRAAMRRHAAGVTIVTLDSPRGPVGFTATSFASLSLQPPLVSFNITCTSSSIDALRGAESVVVHLLGAHQRELAGRFAGSADQRFADAAGWCRLATGEPVLHDTPIWLRGAVERLIPAGDSVLAIVHVIELHGVESEAVAPLLYHGGRWSAAVALTE